MENEMMEPVYDTANSRKGPLQWEQEKVVMNMS